MLDHLFRKYQIDLTVYLQEGRPGLTYSWTNNNSPVEEQPIYEWISKGLTTQHQ